LDSNEARGKLKTEQHKQKQAKRQCQGEFFASSAPINPKGNAN